MLILPCHVSHKVPECNFLAPLKHLSDHIHHGHNLEEVLPVHSSLSTGFAIVTGLVIGF